MKEIDWSKAPEDATHFQPAYSYWDNPVFWRIENEVAREVWVVKSLNEDISDHFTYGPEGNDCYIPERCIERPKQAWSGEGLPPVGTICEYQIKNGPWYECEIKYILDNGDDVVMFCPHLGIEQVAGVTMDRIQFRPIKTQEQLAAEEREKAILEMYRKTLAHAGDYESKIQRKVCESLYDAGYRLTKTEE